MVFSHNCCFICMQLALEFSCNVISMVKKPPELIEVLKTKMTKTLVKL